jgi:hypothetical protein
MANDSKTDDRARTERRASTLQQVAGDFGVSLSTIKRGVSHGLIRTIYFGDRPLVTVDEQDRLQREGLPKIPPGYKRRTTGPTKQGRPRGSKSKKPAKPLRPRKAERERRPSA